MLVQQRYRLKIYLFPLDFSLITHAHKIVNKDAGSNKTPRPAFLSLSFLELPKNNTPFKGISMGV
jgi:hypothetical protein